jgi:phenylacetate-coenzyme A ligase PaaK-like adenylate-forming protein
MQRNSIFNITTKADFNLAALTIFKHQYTNNLVYKTFCNYLQKTPDNVIDVNNIPYLPISFFKTERIVSNTKTPEKIFTSSGTTGSAKSSHYVTDIAAYEDSFSQGFTNFYGDASEYVFLALLPSYLERSGSSLIYMTNALIKQSKHSESGFYLNNLNELANKLTKIDASGKKVILLGVSFALLDLVENYSFNLKNTIVMETGGMKGRRKEIIRPELHKILCQGFGVTEIHSEYGMTELLSQAYSKGNGIFYCPPWMKVTARDTEDPLMLLNNDKTGGLNVIDLANINSCSFIATQDLGKVYSNGSFEVLGRFDDSDIRGCNLLLM